MPKSIAEERKDPAAVRRRINAIFESEPDAKRRYCEVLAGSIAYLSRHHSDRWGVTLHEHGIRLNAGWVESLVLSDNGWLRILLERKSAPKRAPFDGREYRYAPGCETVALPISNLPVSLSNVAKSHHEALRIAADTMPPPLNVRRAHSPGVTKWLSQTLHLAVPNPVRPEARLHIVQGGIVNGDKDRLEDRNAQFWMVPKTATIGDELVIFIRGIGFFATARLTSEPRPRKDWKNRYRADIDSLRLVRPPISLDILRRQFPDFGWARYPRSITSPPRTVADQIRELIATRKRGEIDLDETLVGSANMDELKELALQVARRRVPPKVGTAVYRTASAAIRRYVLRRANGRCEGCGAPAPFRGADGEPFLEAHHTTRLADDGPDHPRKVIGICPNCHKRAHLAGDADSFNAVLIRKLRKLEPAG
jgi:hypothetical protein